MKTIIKRPFTLIEMLMVISLIAVALGVSAIQVSKALQTERFERGVEQIRAKLSLAQELMLDFQTDISLMITHKEREIECLIESARALPKHLESSINRHSKIEGIERVFFEQTTSPNIELIFDATLGSTPTGTLKLLSRYKEQKLTLRGYPAQILRGKDAQEKRPKGRYPEEIISFI